MRTKALVLALFGATLILAFPGVASAAAFTVLHSFSGPDGETPAAPLVQGAERPSGNVSRLRVVATPRLRYCADPRREILRGKGRRRRHGVEVEWVNGGRRIRERTSTSAPTFSVRRRPSPDPKRYAARPLEETDLIATERSCLADLLGRAAKRLIRLSAGSERSPGR